ncbi:MAG: hypothetical protein IH987_02990 [Planctomycetes bacterium]|nr:hypothetical protein [Planctomycetota bacterium]
MNETQNQPLSSFPQRRCVADYGVVDLPETWERFTILCRSAMDELAPLISDMAPRFSAECATLDFSGSRSEDFHRIGDRARSWAVNAVCKLRDPFMTLLASQNSHVDRDLIENTIRQIVYCGAYLASDARLHFGLLPVDLSDRQVDELTRMIQKEIDKWLRLWIDDFQDWAEPHRIKKYRPLVELHGPGKPPTVDGKPKAALTAARYAVVEALLTAGPAGLTTDALDSLSKRRGARDVLKRLARSDSDWESVILMPGSPGKHYRLRFG